MNDMKGKMSFGDRYQNQVIANQVLTGKLQLAFTYDCWVRRLGGALLEEWLRLKQCGEVVAAQLFFDGHAPIVDAWQEPNVITDVGIDEVLDSIFAANGGTHYFMLCDGTPSPVVGDTMSSHVTWVEVTAYDEATRPALTMAAASGKSKATSAATAFTIDTSTTTVGGAAITDQNTKGGTSGILLSAANFTSGDRALLDNDVLNMTVTLTGADT